jgi:hypothetical protein
MNQHSVKSHLNSNLAAVRLPETFESDWHDSYLAVSKLTGLVFHSLIIASCALAFISCAPKPLQLYPGPPKPRESVAIVVAEAYTEIDGQVLRSNTGYTLGHALLPGKHKITYWAGKVGAMPANPNDTIRDFGKPQYVYAFRDNTYFDPQNTRYYGWAPTSSVSGECTFQAGHRYLIRTEKFEARLSYTTYEEFCRKASILKYQVIVYDTTQFENSSTWFPNLKDCPIAARLK